jgi:dolichyl-phosphate beta-glucosyltransferase
VALARGDFVMTMDVDLSVPVEFLHGFIEALRNDPSVDILVGNRQHAESVIGVRQTKLRETLGKVFNFGVRFLGISSLKDTQCGFKVFRREAAEAIFSRQTIDGFACDVETLFLAEQMGFVVRDLPVTWINSPDSRVKIFRDSLGMLVDLIRVRAIVRRTLARNPFRKPALVESRSGY